MFDEAFKNSRKFIGVPIAILLVVMIALASGGGVLAAYVWGSARVDITVVEPLRCEAQEAWGFVEDGNAYVWTLDSVYPNTTSVGWLRVWNDGPAEIPLAVDSGLNCPIEMADGIHHVVDILDTTQVNSVGVVPNGGYVWVRVTITVDADVDLSGETWATVDIALQRVAAP